MAPTMFELPPTNVDHNAQARRVSTEPAEGYVLDPWSGLYLETEPTFRHRMAAEQPA